MDGKPGALGTELDPRMHKVMCGDRYCKPGEGNLKGYSQWHQPYANVAPNMSRVTKGAPGWGNNDPFPAASYRAVIAKAQEVQQGHTFVIMSVADFDYRYLAWNWHRAAQGVGATNAFVHALDNEAFEFLHSRHVPCTNGTGHLLAWTNTRLMRHIQRALAERFMAAMALMNAGLNVLMMDVSSVIIRSPIAFFHEQAAADVDMYFMRSGCSPKKDVGCSIAWNFAFYRGASTAERRDRILKFVRRGMATCVARAQSQTFARMPCPSCKNAERH